MVIASVFPWAVCLGRSEVGVSRPRHWGRDEAPVAVSTFAALRPRKLSRMSCSSPAVFTCKTTGLSLQEVGELDGIEVGTVVFSSSHRQNSGGW